MSGGSRRKNRSRRRWGTELVDVLGEHERDDDERNGDAEQRGGHEYDGARHLPLRARQVHRTLQAEMRHAHAQRQPPARRHLHHDAHRRRRRRWQRARLRRTVS